MSLLSALSISASGMSAQRQRTELLVENLANSDTTRTPEGGPYRRKDAVFVSDPSAADFSSMFESEMGAGSGVRATKASCSPSSMLHHEASSISTSTACW